MTDHDLTAELDDAECIVSGEVEKVITEWGVRYSNGDTHPASSEQKARDWFDYQSGTPIGQKWGVALVKRKITVGEWKDA